MFQTAIQMSSISVHVRSRLSGTGCSSFSVLPRDARSAKRGITIVSCPSVRMSVTLRYVRCRIGNVVTDHLFFHLNQSYKSPVRK